MKGRGEPVDTDVVKRVTTHISRMLPDDEFKYASTFEIHADGSWKQYFENYLVRCWVASPESSSHPGFLIDNAQDIREMLKVEVLKRHTLPRSGMMGNCVGCQNDLRSGFYCHLGDCGSTFLCVGHWISHMSQKHPEEAKANASEGMARV